MGREVIFIGGLAVEAVAFLGIGLIVESGDPADGGRRLCQRVYHPADYALPSASAFESRMGRAFSLHTFTGLPGSRRPADHGDAGSTVWLADGRVCRVSPGLPRSRL